jgi:hypothetical protein
MTAIASGTLEMLARRNLDVVVATPDDASDDATN